MTIFADSKSVNLQYFKTYYIKDKVLKAAHLSQVELEYVANVVGIKL